MTLVQIDLHTQQFQSVRILPEWHDARCLFGQLHRPILASLIQQEQPDISGLAAWINILFYSLPEVFKSFYAKAMLHMSPKEQQYVRAAEMTLQRSTPTGHPLVGHYVTRYLSKITSGRIPLALHSKNSPKTVGKRGSSVISSSIKWAQRSFGSTSHRLKLKTYQSIDESAHPINPAYLHAFHLFCYLNRSVYCSMMRNPQIVDSWLPILFSRLSRIHVEYYANAMNLILPEERLVVIDAERQIINRHHKDGQSLLNLSSVADVEKNTSPVCDEVQSRKIPDRPRSPNKPSALAFRIFYLRHHAKYDSFDTIQELWRNISEQECETYEIAAILTNSLSEP
jgi:hypothetical protein